MDVVLISCYSQIESTGLRVLSACLKRAGFETRMLFLPDIEEMMVAANYGERQLSPAALRQVVELCAGAQLVGIGAMTVSFFLARQITQALHGSTDVPVIWGGVHPTIRPAECLQHADLVCIGEGEKTMAELARRIAAGRDYRDVGNLAWLDGDGHLVSNPLYPMERDLDALPFPDYDFGDHFVLHEGRFVPFTADLMAYYLTDLGSWAQGPVYGVLMTRGCPYRCAYCINNTMTDIYPDWCKLRRRSLENVMAEIQAARARLPSISAVAIRDDTFLANPRSYIATFSRQYQDRVGLPFRVHTTAQTADPVKLQHLADAGMKLVIMGIQTGSPRIQELYNRHITNEQILQAAHVIHRFQPWAPRPIYDLIVDNPYATDEDRFQTLRLIHQLPRPYRLSLYTLTFYPGTDLYERAKEDGLIEEEEQEIYRRNFQMYRANRYNLILFCHSLNLPVTILYLLSRRIIFDILGWGPLNWLCGLALRGLLALRLIKNRRLYAHRRAQWLGEEEQARHA